MKDYNLFKHLNREMNRKPKWSFGQSKAKNRAYKGKKVKFRVIGVKKARRIKKRDSWVFSKWGVLFIVLPMVIGGPVIGCLFILLFVFKAAWDLGHYEKVYETGNDKKLRN